MAGEITTFTNIEILGSHLFVTKEALDGTRKYEVIVNNGEPVLNLLSDITYQNEIITIQPLN